MLRYAVGALVLLPFAGAALALLRARPPARDLAAMAALGIGQFGVLIALLNWGLQHTGAAPAALIFSLLPLLAMLIAAALGRERVSAPLLAGVLLSIAGVALALAPKLSAAHGGAWWGEAAVLGSALVGALCSVLYRPYLQRYPTVPVSAYAMLASVAALALLALGEGWPRRIGGFDGTTWACIAFLGISSGIGYFWWLYALKHESPTRVTMFLALNPLTAALLGHAWLGEPLHATTWLGLAFAGSGLALGTRGAATAKRQAPPG